MPEKMDNELGGLQDRLRHFGEEPDDRIWQSIEDKLAKKRKKRPIFWWLAAALILVSISTVVVIKNSPIFENRELTRVEKATSTKQETHEQPTFERKKSKHISDPKLENTRNANPSVVDNELIAKNETTFQNQVDRKENQPSANEPTKLKGKSSNLLVNVPGISERTSEKRKTGEKAISKSKTKPRKTKSGIEIQRHFLALLNEKIGLKKRAKSELESRSIAKDNQKLRDKPGNEFGNPDNENQAQNRVNNLLSAENQDAPTIHSEFSTPLKGDSLLSKSSQKFPIANPDSLKKEKEIVSEKSIKKYRFELFAATKIAAYRKISINQTPTEKHLTLQNDPTPISDRFAYEIGTRLSYFINEKWFIQGYFGMSYFGEHLRGNRELVRTENYDLTVYGNELAVKPQIIQESISLISRQMAGNFGIGLGFSLSAGWELNGALMSQYRFYQRQEKTFGTNKEWTEDGMTFSSPDIAFRFGIRRNLTRGKGQIGIEPMVQWFTKPLFHLQPGNFTSPVYFGIQVSREF